MSRKNLFRFFVIFAVLMVLQISCSLGSVTSLAGQLETVVDAVATVPAGVSTEVPVISVPKGPPTPTPFVYNGPSPAAGSGGVYGRLLWNGGPVEGLEVKLCDEIKFIGGCTGAEFPSITDANGVYAILDVPPGSYGLTYHAVDSDTWYYVTSGFLDAEDFEVPADDMVNVGDFNTVRTDLVILSPMEDERMDAVSRPVISWEPYPEAAYYELTFHSGRGGSLIHRMKLTETSFTMDRDLQSCDYSFDIEVFNAQEVVIAEYDGWRNFEIAGLPQDCVLVALTPADGATVPADGITLSWEPHDWTDVYKLHMYNTADNSLKILDFVETKETSYKVTQEVPAGEYYWVVYAYDKFGDGLGFSTGLTMHVTSP